ncbi:ArdC-like ssDNA-binding domain-containing protein, partial [Anaerospora hongkongensis]
MAKPNFRQEITDQIIELMEKGDTPWQKPWNSTIGRDITRPVNAVTNRL